MARGVIDIKGMNSPEMLSLKNTQTPYDTPFKITKIGHVVLKVTDLKRSVDFYTQVLGFKVSDVYPENMMPGRMFVGGMSQGPEYSPFFTALGQQRQVLTNLHTRQFCGTNAKRSAILKGPIWLGIPGVDMAGATGHPEQDHALAASQRLPGSGGFGTDPHELRQREACHAGQGCLEHASPVLHHEAFTDTRVQPGEGVVVAVKLVVHDHGL